MKRISVLQFGLALILLFALGWLAKEFQPSRYALSVPISSKPAGATRNDAKAQWRQYTVPNETYWGRLFDDLGVSPDVMARSYWCTTRVNATKEEIGKLALPSNTKIVVVLGNGECPD